MRTDHVGLWAADPDGPYTVVGPIRVRVKQRSLLSRRRTTDEVDSELRSAAARVGANAVIHVQYRQRGYGWNYVRAIDGTGTAVVAVEAHRACPSCRERMRRDASVCPHCRSATEPWTFHNGYWWIAREEGRYYLDPTSHQWMRPTAGSSAGSA